MLRFAYQMAICFWPCATFCVPCGRSPRKRLGVLLKCRFWFSRSGGSWDCNSQHILRGCGWFTENTLSSKTLRNSTSGALEQRRLTIVPLVWLGGWNTTSIFFWIYIALYSIKALLHAWLSEFLPWNFKRYWVSIFSPVVQVKKKVERCPQGWRARNR